MPRPPISFNDWNDLHIVLTVAEHRGFARAAKDLGVDQTTVAGVEVKRTQLLLDLGRLDDAMGLAQLNDIEARYPGFIPAILSRADLKKFTAEDRDIAVMERELLNPVLDSAVAASLHFSLGKAYLDLRDGGRAFNHLEKANAIRRQTIEFKPETVEETFSMLMARYPSDPQVFSSPPPSSGPVPIFVVGMPRSGTSLTEQILASHPSVTGAGELSTLSNIESALFDDAFAPIDVREISPERLRKYGQQYRDHIAALSLGMPYVVDKMPGNFRNIGLMRLILPEAKIIHCRRDPLDTCLSIFTKNFQDEMRYAFSQEHLGRYYHAYQSITNHWRSILPATAWLEIDYEDTVADLEAQTRKLLDYIGLPWHDACLAFWETKRQVRTASTRQVRRPLYNTSVKASQPFEAYLQPLIKALAGEPDPMLTFTITADQNHIGGASAGCAQ